MRANHLPQAKDLPEADRQAQEVALGKALRATATLLKKPLISTQHQEIRLLGRDPFQLEKQAIDRPTILSADGQLIEIDYDRFQNTIYPEVTPGEYTITYTIGFEQEKIPAIVRELILLLGTWFLRKERNARDDAMSLLPIARKLK